MLTYNEVIELAKQCALNARLAITKEAAAELWKMAKECQEEAAKLDGGRTANCRRRSKTSFRKRSVQWGGHRRAR
jgi:hypothetical protein